MILLYVILSAFSRVDNRIEREIILYQLHRSLKLKAIPGYVLENRNNTQVGQDFMLQRFSHKNRKRNILLLFSVFSHTFFNTKF